MHPGPPFLPSEKGVTRVSTLAFPLRATSSDQLTRCMCRLSHQTEHHIIRVHVVMSQ